MIRVAFFGPMCVGKTWCADILANELDFEKLSFATAVKDTARKLFGVTTKSAESRRILQLVGEKMREIDPNVWINQVVNTVNDHPNVDYVVDDLRYVNEAEALKSLGFTLILVTVPEDVRQERINHLYPDTTREDHLHISELEHVMITPDYVIESTTEDTEEHLYHVINAVEEVGV
jgi:hypothetical protein